MIAPFSRKFLSARGLLGLAGVGVLGLGLGFAGASCNKMPLTAPSGSSVTLFASTNNLPVNGSTDITAVVVEGSLTAGNNPAVTSGAGTPVANGTLVSFTTTLGHLDPTEARTDGGKAVVKLYADGQSGTATINAFSGPANGKTTVSIGAAGAAKIFVTANPQTLSASGGSATVVAQVQDAQGNGLLGVPVSFGTDAGTLSVTSGLSDVGGNVTTTLSTSATATVTASAGGGTSALTATVKVTVKPKVTIALTPPASITVSVPAVFAIDVGTSVVKDVVIDFGDGNSASLGQVSSKVSVTKLYGQAGAMTVKVTATDPDGQTVVVSSPIAVAQLVAVLSGVPSTSTPGLVQFTVTVSTGAAIDHYEWDFGDGSAPLTTLSNAQGHLYTTPGGHTAVVKVVPQAGPTIILTFPIVTF